LVDLKSKRIEGHDYVSFQMEIPDELNMGVFHKEKSQNSKYDLFAAFVLEPM